VKQHMESRPGGTKLVEPRAQAAALPPGGVAMQPWWTGGGLGAVSPAVVAPGIGLSSNSPVGRAGKAGDDASGESTEESRRSGESKGPSSFRVSGTSSTKETGVVVGTGSSCTGSCSLLCSSKLFLVCPTSLLYSGSDSLKIHFYI
jgi:hypothetical protein